VDSAFLNGSATTNAEAFEQGYRDLDDVRPTLAWSSGVAGKSTAMFASAGQDTQAPVPPVSHQSDISRPAQVVVYSSFSR
jgi:hypothetical protein